MKLLIEASFSSINISFFIQAHYVRSLSYTCAAPRPGYDVSPVKPKMVGINAKHTGGKDFEIPF